MNPSTFSIVAYDPSNGDLGIAVESKFLAVGAVVPFARAGVGAIATQSYANTAYGPRALAQLKRGATPRAIANALVASDKDREMRQFGIVDARGRAFSYTGKKCFAWAGGRVGKNYAAQGNILAGAGVVDALAETFENTRGDLAPRLLAALAAGQRAGGDKRGQESAALLVVRAKGGYAGFNDRYIDLRVDDHPAPIEELTRLVDLHHLYLGKTRAQDILALDANIARELQVMMGTRGYYRGAVNGAWDDASRAAFREFAGVENLEDRLLDGARIDRVVLEFLRKHFQPR
ncbi:MAG: DUF1028 domain-containing protein [Chloroflexi bacterium]|nr:DUF1028 domain-containing protein [Chloroflexota bacterium]MBI3741154.1 DUF1028 domain-containing protein [Chloroflexota bacterium]